MSFVASQPEPARFDTLGNLPGGVGQYMRVVKDVCDYVCHNADANLAGVARTVAKERPVAPKSMESYLGTLGRTVIVRHIDDRITLTPLGKQIAQAPTCDERSRLMADALVQRCTGMAQLLALYDNEASNDLSLKDIQAGLGSRFSNWKEATNYKIRNYWLVELRCVVATRSRHNAITPLGRDVLHYNFPDTHALLAVETNADPIDDELDQTSIIDENEDMLDELHEASVASNNYRRLQEAVGVCFRFV